MTVLQTVQVFAPGSPKAPFVQRAAGGGWHYDCGNCAGWTLYYPKPCECGHCLPTYEAVRAAAPEGAVCACKHVRDAHREGDQFSRGWCDTMVTSGWCRCETFRPSTPKPGRST